MPQNVAVPPPADKPELPDQGSDPSPAVRQASGLLRAGYGVAGNALPYNSSWAEAETRPWYGHGRVIANRR